MRVTATIEIPDAELIETFIRASGPGGQNVNKVATAVELRFDVRATQALSPEVRSRLESLAGNRVTNEGVLVIRAERFRTQERNRADARERLCRLVERAATPPRPRVPTRPSRAAKERRLKAKSQRSTLKDQRRSRPTDD